MFAACVLLISQNKILAIRSPHKNSYGIPGGKLNEGENYLDGAYRELEEETGIKEEQIDQYLKGTFIDFCKSKRNPDAKEKVITYVFASDSLIDLEVKESSEGVAFWTTQEDLLANGTYSEYNHMLLDAFQNYFERESYDLFTRV
jgi:ADP-ribose pyrophosphatase YjhB (NUDIX family)